ncbi:MAG: polysaccharide biosynthesis C-terminal domain-containing protein, partial [Thermoplasmata archaeon]
LLIPSAFDAAIYPLFSRLYESSAGDMKYAYGKSIKFSLVVAIPVAVMLAILSRDVASIFGSDYENTGRALFIMAALLPLYTINMLMKTALWSSDAQKQIAVNIWLAVIVIITVSYFLILDHAYLGAALALVISEAVFLALNYRSSRNKGFPMGRYLGKPVVAGICMIGSALGLNLAASEASPYYIALMAGLVYTLAVLLMGFITRSDRALIRNALSRRKP